MTTLASAEHKPRAWETVKRGLDLSPELRAGALVTLLLALLTTARDWALAHASLLSLGHRGMTQEPAVCHLMTDSPKSVRRLGDSELKLHLLTGSGDRWVCVELN